jgi:NAD(P)-dependent dehydrogenase (short-subunit alcohol dehydrogenase family)
VNLICPANVAAGAALKVYEEDRAYREFVGRVTLGRRNSPESIADAFVFLCSPLAAEINGHILNADYGSAIGNRL